jgi:hypothetical protein
MKKFLLILLALSTLFTLTACHNRKQITVWGMLNNQTKAPAYMWLGHQDVPTEADLIGPGGFRQVGISLNAYMEDDVVEEIEDMVKASASNDGKNVVHESLSISKDYKGSGNLFIRWNGSQLSLGY